MRANQNNVVFFFSLYKHNYGLETPIIRRTSNLPEHRDMGDIAKNREITTLCLSNKSVPDVYY